MSDDIAQLLADEADAAESVADMNTPYVRNRTRSKEPAQVYSLRIPVEYLEDLRKVAERMSVAPTALMRRWVVERLDVELARTSDLEQRRADVLADRSDEQLIVLTREELVITVSGIVKSLKLPAVDDAKPGRHSAE